MKKLILLSISILIQFSCQKEREIYPATDSPLTLIQSFRLVTETGANAISNVQINAENATVTILANPDVSITRLFPSATISEGAIVEPALGVYTDFSTPVTYTVIAGNRIDKQQWTVTVTN